MKACSRCREEKPLDEFSPGKRYKNGRRPVCRACVRQEHAANKAEFNARARARYHAKAPEQKRAEGQRYYERKREAVKARAAAYRAAHLDECRARDAAYRVRTIEEQKAYQNTRRRDRRERVLRSMGGRCACCGEHRLELLAIDHVHGDGAAHRRETGLIGTKLVNWLLENGIPGDTFQLLCHNCNFAKGKDRTCPHVLERRRLDASHAFIEDEYTA
jgi:hypothetical protein